LWTSGSSGFKATYHKLTLTYVLLQVPKSLVPLSLDLEALRSQKEALGLAVSREVDGDGGVVDGFLEAMDTG
jgi:hypothetical protein